MTETPGEYHVPGEKQTFRITEIWAYLSIDDGGEGICAFADGEGRLLPMLAADKKRLDSLRPIAEDMARRTGKMIRLCKFREKVILEEIYPSEGAQNKA